MTLPLPLSLAPSLSLSHLHLCAAHGVDLGLHRQQGRDQGCSAVAHRGRQRRPHGGLPLQVRAGQALWTGLSLGLGVPFHVKVKEGVHVQKESFI